MSNLSGNYLHIRADDGKIFYVGLGNEQRAKSKQNRNIFWQRTVKKHGYKVKYLGTRSIEEAKNLEMSLIKIFGRACLNKGTLVNMTDGGDGVRNLSPKSKLQHKESLLRVAKNPTTIEKRSAASKRRFSDEPAFVKKHRESYQKDSTQEKLSNNAKANWVDTEYREKLIKHVSNSWNDPVIREARMAKMKEAKRQAYAVAQLLGIKRKQVTRELRLANLHLIENKNG